MAWHHIGDEQLPNGTTFTSNVTTADMYTGAKCTRVETSTKTIAHSIFRCGNCRALAVTQQGHQPSGKCQKCHA